MNRLKKARMKILLLHIRNPLSVFFGVPVTVKVPSGERGVVFLSVAFTGLPPLL
jgi:hypothetical protein